MKAIQDAITAGTISPKTDREILAKVTRSTNHAHIAGVGRNLEGTGNLDSGRAQPDPGYCNREQLEDLKRQHALEKEEQRKAFEIQQNALKKFVDFFNRQQGTPSSQFQIPDLYTPQVFLGSISTPGGPSSTSPALSFTHLSLGNCYTPTLDLETSQSGEQEDDSGSDDGNGRGHCKKETSVRLRDYVTNTVKKKSPSCSTPPAQSRSSGTPYPMAHYVNCDEFSSCHRTFLEAIEKEREPVTYYEAIKDKRWRSAIDSELEAPEQNKTWMIEKLPPNKKDLGCKWVYKIKYKSDGTIERFKARSVILSNHQVAGVYYSETFAPITKMVTIRVFLAIVAAKQWELHQMDVHNAFLHGDLEEVFMKLPPGLHKGQPGEACKLRKSLYGLRKAPRCWFLKLSSALKKYDFVQSYSDYSLFIQQQNMVQLNVLMYVDNLIVSENDHEAITQFDTYLSNCFHMKDLGNLKYFLGIEVAHAK
nr:retrovirus-related Pol polyprotein from transposon TNT 1-94 [Tanacetum cinerariifolium]